MRKAIFDRLVYFFRRNKSLLVLILLLLGMSVVLYRNYIFGQRLFLFEDFGSDSVRVSLPTYIFLFNWLGSGMNFWSDKMGIGTSVLSHSDVILDPFTYILFLFGKENIVFMFIYMVIAKIILSGVFFWAFLSKFDKKISPFSKVLGPLAYAFGGYMIVVGQNYVFSTIYVYVPIIFLGFELWFQDRKKWLLILSLFLTALYFFYFFYMTAIFFSVYAVYRYLIVFRFEYKHFARYLMSLLIYGLISLGLSSFYWLPSLALTLSNLRVSPSLPSLGNLIIVNTDMLVTVSGRMLGYDSLGPFNGYYGFSKDYYELPVFSGILTILLIPQIFKVLNKKNKTAFKFFISVLITILFIPLFSYIFNGLSTLTYRWIFSIFFSISLFFSLCVNKIFQEKIISFRILFATAFLLFLIPFFVVNHNSPLQEDTLYEQLRFYKNFPAMREHFQTAFRIFIKDYLIIGVYLLLIVSFFKLNKYRNWLKAAILLLFCLELVLIPSRFINERLTTPSNIVENKKGFFDHTNEAIDYIAKKDNGFYRIDKSYDSVKSELGEIPSMNDSMAQNYRGLKSYNANNQPNYIRFLQYAGIHVIYPRNAQLKKLKPEQIRDPNLNYINGVGDRFLLQSFLGVKYYLSKGRDKVPEFYKHLANIKGISIYENQFFLPLGFTFEKYITFEEYKNLNINLKDLALLSFVVIDNEDNAEGLIKGDISELANADVKKLIDSRKKEAFPIDNYTEDKIEGEVSVSENKILVFSVPYDSGWSLYIDGKKTGILKVDGGLIGVKLHPGKHEVRLSYFPPMMRTGIFISIGTLATVFLYLYLKKRKTTHLIGIKLNEKYSSIKLSLPSFIYRNNLNSQKLIFYPAMLLGITSFFISGILTRGSAFYNFFQSNTKDYFMDFFNPLSELVYGPYAQGSIYPPLPLFIYRLLLRFIPYDIASLGAVAIRNSQVGQLVFLFYLLITIFVFFWLLNELKKGNKTEKFIFIFIILFSSPFLFLFERANIIIVSLISLMSFVLLKDSKKKILREIGLLSLAFSASIKLYPIIFGFVYLKEKRFKDFSKLILYSLLLFVVPLLALGGIENIQPFFRNLLSTSSNVINWGVGYSVSITTSTRIIFAFFGEFGSLPVLIGNLLSGIALVLGIISVSVINSKWKVFAILSLLAVLIPAISAEYTTIFLIIPLIFLLDGDRKMSKLDYLYLFLLILSFIPFTFGRIDMLTKGFGSSARPLTWNTLIHNFSLSLMFILLLSEGLKELIIKLRIKLNDKKRWVFYEKIKKFYWVVPVSVIFAYNINFFNKSYPVTEGWFSVYAWLVNQGEVPYRDFYLFLTPLYTLIISLFTSIFGYELIYLRMLGVVVIALTTYFFYKNLEIIFGRAIAAFAVIVGMIYYQSGVAHITYDFIQFLTLFGLMQSYFLLRHINLEKNEKTNYKWIILAGLLGGLTFLTKQSNGLVIGLFSLLGTLLILFFERKKTFLKECGAYLVGYFIPVSLIFSWLWVNSALKQFFDQALLGASSAKGGLNQILFSWLRNLFNYNFWVRFIEILKVVFIFGYWVYFLIKKRVGEKISGKIIALFGTLLLFLIFYIPLFAEKNVIDQFSSLAQIGINNVIVAAISVPAIIICISLILYFLKKPINKNIFLVSFVAIGFIYGTGTSAGITEAGAFFGFSICIALMLYYSSVFNFGKIFILLFSLSFCLMLVQAKYSRPYSWWNVVTPDIRSEMVKLENTLILNGLYTSEENITMIKEISHELIKVSDKETILAFPNIPVFYLLADKKPPGKAVVYWFDFLPDELALKEAELIKENPPGAIVYLDLGPSVWEAHERLFRDGKPSGQRKISESILDLVRKENMHVVKKYFLPNKTTLTVYKK